MAKTTKNPDGSEQRSKTFRFRVREGSHFDEKGKEYFKGDIIESDHDLAETFANKFDRVGGDGEGYVEEGDIREKPFTDASGPQGPTGAPEAAAAKPQTPGPIKSKGSDVTARFKDAKDQDFVVYQDGNGFTVYDKDDMSKPVNDKPVAEKDVPKVISDALKK